MRLNASDDSGTDWISLMFTACVCLRTHEIKTSRLTLTQGYWGVPDSHAGQGAAVFRSIGLWLQCCYLRGGNATYSPSRAFSARILGTRKRGLFRLLFLHLCRLLHQWGLLSIVNPRVYIHGLCVWKGGCLFSAAWDHCLCRLVES